MPALPAQRSRIVIPAEAGTHGATTMIFYVYLLSSQPHGTLYVGVASDLVGRVWLHKQKAVPGFTAKYRVDRLTWYEAHQCGTVRSAVKSRSRNGSALGRYS